MVLNVHRNHEAYQRRGEGGGSMEVGKRKIIYPSLHCHHQDGSCIKMGSDESHFNVLLVVRDKVTRPSPQTTTFEEKGDPKRIRIEVPLLTSLTPYREAKPAHIIVITIYIPIHTPGRLQRLFVHSPRSVLSLGRPCFTCRCRLPRGEQAIVRQCRIPLTRCLVNDGCDWCLFRCRQWV